MATGTPGAARYPIVMCPCSLAANPRLSVIVTVNANVPVVVGVPVIETGGAVDSVKLGGSAPAAIEALYGPRPPEMKKFWRYDWPAVPELQHVAGNVIFSAAGVPIAMLKAWVAVWPALSRALIVNVNVPACVGVPPIASPQQP